MNLIVILVSIGITSVICFGLGLRDRSQGCFVLVVISLVFSMFSVFLCGAISELAIFLGLMQRTGGDVWGLMNWFFLGPIVFPIAYAFGKEKGGTK